MEKDALLIDLSTDTTPQNCSNSLEVLHYTMISYGICNDLFCSVLYIQELLSNIRFSVAVCLHYVVLFMIFEEVITTCYI